MGLTAYKVNFFLFFNLPAAFWCGVRLQSINQVLCITSVKYRWFNKNPFRSLYFAVLSMTGELSTGALVMQAIQATGRNVSMLVVANNCVYLKKAVGTIIFTCNDGQQVISVVNDAVASNEGRSIKLQTIGTNESGEIVAKMEFEWTVKVKN